MAWGKLGSTTLSSTSDVIDVTSLSNNKFIMLLNHGLYSGDSNGTFTFNDSTGNEYAIRQSFSGGSDGSSNSRANFTYSDSSVHDSIFATSYILNIAGEEKIIISYQATVTSTGASNAPNRAEQVGKWINTSDAITSIKHTQSSSGGDYISGSNVSVLGSDMTPAAAVTFPSDVPDYTRAEITDTRKIYTRLPGSVASSTYDSKSFDTGSQAASVRALSFSADGTKMYALDSHTNDAVYQYTLSTAWDVSTASYASKSFGVATQDNQPHGIEFKSDGTKMYLSGIQNDKIYQYSLSTAWDISTSSYDSVSLSVSGQATTPTGVTFKSDGTKIYLSDGYTSNKIYQYSLSSAWDLSTASYDSVYLDVSSQDNQLNDLQLNSDGTKLYIIGNQNDNVCQYSLSTAWDLSTASYDSKSFNVTSQEEFPEGLFLSSDDTKFYIIGRQNDTVFQYSIGTTSWKEKGTT